VPRASTGAASVPSGCTNPKAGRLNHRRADDRDRRTLVVFSPDVVASDKIADGKNESSSRMTTPFPIRSVPRIPAVKASSGTSERKSTSSRAPPPGRSGNSSAWLQSGRKRQCSGPPWDFPRNLALILWQSRLRVSSRAIISRYTLPVEDGQNIPSARVASNPRTWPIFTAG